MNLKKMWKRFWNLNVHNHEGFTLVELIIVIAILAILSSVAVVGYSSYITKANKQADMTLAAEIKNALVLAMYSDALTDGDYVIVYFDKTKPAEASATAAAAMEAAFGANWQNMHLSYGDWDMGVISDSTMMGYVGGSTFDADPETLKGMLDGVSVATGIMADLVNSGSWTPSDEMADFLEDNGIEYGVGNGDAVANATVMFVAGNMTSSLKGKEADFAKAWYNMGYESITVPTFDVVADPVSQAAAQFAFAEALASHVDNANPGVKFYTDANGNPCTYVEYLHQAKNAGNPSTLKSAMNAVVSDIASKTQSNVDISLAVCEYYGFSGENGVITQAPIESTKAYQDGMAFIAYMQGITSATDSLMSNTDLSNPNYYTDGSMLNYVTDYVAMHNLVKGIEDAFAFYYNAETGEVRCVPLDY